MFISFRLEQSMLYFTRPLTEIHGCLLVDGDKSDTVIKNVVNTVTDILRRSRDEEELNQVKRKIVLYLAVNTNLAWPSQVSTVWLTQKILIS